MAKKIIITLSIVLILILLGWVAWVLFLQPDDEAGGEVSIRDFFPFGQSPSSDELRPPPETIEDDLPDVPTTPEKVPQLRKISENPVSGATSFTRNEETVIRFVDRATGHIFETEGETMDVWRISNTTVPQIHEAVWTEPNVVILRHLRDDEETIESVVLRLIETEDETSGPFEFLIDLEQGDTGTAVRELQKTLNLDQDTQVASQGAGSPGNETMIFGPATFSAVMAFQEKYASEILEPQGLEEAPGVVDSLTREKLNEINGVGEEIEDEEGSEFLMETTLTFLPTDIKSLAFLKDIGKIFYLREDSLGTVGTLSNPDGTQAVQIFESPVKEWLASPVAGNILSLTSKASVDSPGVLVTLDANGNTEKILGGIDGLTSLINPNLSKVAFSESQKGTLTLNFYNLDTNETIHSDTKTLPQKCTWSKKNVSEILYCAVPTTVTSSDYPDSWYKGVVSFSDLLLKIDTKSNPPIAESLTTGPFRLEFLNKNIDVVELFLDQEEKYLFFINKNDYSLWNFKIEKGSPEASDAGDDFQEENE